MPSRFAKVVLFLSSYAPLGAMFFVLWLPTHPIVAVISLILGVFGIVGLYIFLAQVQRFTSNSVNPVDVRRADTEAMSYIVSYIIPFLAVPFASTNEAIALLIFLAVLGFVYVNSNMLNVNPTLLFLGYHLYEVSLEGGATFSTLARGRILRNTEVEVVRVGDDILVEKRE